MKKFLIALPLVLIMVLSMIPAFAADVTLNVEVKYADSPTQKNIVKTETYQMTVSEAVAKDQAKLAKEVEKQIRDRNQFPNLNADRDFEWGIDVNATAAKAASEEKTYIKKTFDGTVDKLIAEANKEADPKVEISKGDGVEANITKEGLEKVNANLKAGTYKFTIEKADTSATPAGEEVEMVVYQPEVKPVAAVPASANATAYPKCYLNQKEEVKEACPVLCSEIKVQITDVFHGVILKDYTRIYKVDKSVYPRFENIYNSYMKNFFPVDDYQIVNDWFGQKWIEIPGLLPKQIGEDCTINIKVIPTVQKVNVIHVFQDCCKNIDGTYNYNVWKTFVEQNVYVDFIGYQTELLFDHAKAAEFAATRIQKINATDFVFVNAMFDDGMRLDGYMTGQVYDLNGKLVKKIENSAPVIKLIYRRAECVEQTEAQVDNATVANNANTTAPATANAGQLPATGAKDVSAFFLSAVALLGLGIFFAKKH